MGVAIRTPAIWSYEGDRAKAELQRARTLVERELVPAVPMRPPCPVSRQASVPDPAAYRAEPTPG